MAISENHDDCPEVPMGGHPLSSMFRRLCPAKARLVPNWDLKVVLSARARPPIEPLGLASLKNLSTKVAFQLAITSTKRISELHALSVSAECFRMGADKGSAFLRSDASFLMKVLSDGHVNRTSYGCEWAGFSPSVLCPVRALETYHTRT